MIGSHPTRHAVNSLLERAFREGRVDMTPVKIQKMLYLTHGWHLATAGAPAIDRPFKVGAYGPAVTAVEKELRPFGDSFVATYLPEDSSGRPFVVSQTQKAFHDALDVAWRSSADLPAEVLSTLTHSAGTPWDVARRRNLTLIPNALIQAHFVGMVRRA